MGKNLLERCAEFEKLAISVQENTDPVLKQLSDFQKFDERVEFAKKKWEKLGEGSSRTVFKINDHLIIKIAHNEKGLAQNYNEMEPDLQRSCATDTIVADPKGKWLITHYTDSITKEDFKKIIGFGFDSFVNSLSFSFNNEEDITEPRDYDEIKKHPFFLCIGHMIINGNLLIGDLSKISSYGFRDGNVYLRDYGFTKDVHKKFYGDKS